MVAGGRRTIKGVRQLKGSDPFITRALPANQKHAGQLRHQPTGFLLIILLKLCQVTLVVA